jgi:hypothetical protein
MNPSLNNIILKHKVPDLYSANALNIQEIRILAF